MLELGLNTGAGHTVEVAMVENRIRELERKYRGR